MNAKTAVLSLVSLLSLATLGCARSSDPSGADVAVGSNPSAAAADAYSLDVKHWEGPVGEEGYVTVTVEARGDHKINVEYPQRLQLDEPPNGMLLPLRELKLADAQLESAKRLTYTVPVNSNRAGEYELSGAVKLSVCSAEACHIQKKQLAARVTVQ